MMETREPFSRSVPATVKTDVEDRGTEVQRYRGQSMVVGDRGQRMVRLYVLCVICYLCYMLSAKQGRARGWGAVV
jgi:hypothetical protein